MEAKSPTLPMMPDGRVLSGMRVGINPDRFVYGDPTVLAWMREELLKRESTGMPRPTDTTVNWRL